MSQEFRQVYYHKDGSPGRGILVNGEQEGYWEWYRREGTRLRPGYLVLGAGLTKWGQLETTLTILPGQSRSPQLGHMFFLSNPDAQHYAHPT